MNFLRKLAAFFHGGKTRFQLDRKDVDDEEENIAMWSTSVTRPIYKNIEGNGESECEEATISLYDTWSFSDSTTIAFTNEISCHQLVYQVTSSEFVLDENEEHIGEESEMKLVEQQEEQQKEHQEEKSSESQDIQSYDDNDDSDDYKENFADKSSEQIAIIKKTLKKQREDEMAQESIEKRTKKSTKKRTKKHALDEQVDVQKYLASLQNYELESDESDDFGSFYEVWDDEQGMSTSTDKDKTSQPSGYSPKTIVEEEKEEVEQMVNVEDNEGLGTQTPVSKSDSSLWRDDSYKGRRIRDDSKAWQADAEISGSMEDDQSRVESISSLIHMSEDTDFEIRESGLDDTQQWYDYDEFLTNPSGMPSVVSSVSSNSDPTGVAELAEGSSTTIGKVEGAADSIISLLPEVVVKMHRRQLCRRHTRRIFFKLINIQVAELLHRDLQQHELVKLVQDDIVLTITNFRRSYDGEKKRLWIKKVWHQIVSVFRYGIKDEAFVLSYYEFYVMLIFNEIYVEQLLNDFALIEHLGPLLGVLVKLFTVVVVDAPMMMFVLTMAGITRAKYLKFYHAMPLLRGIGYAMLMLFLLNEGRTCKYLDLGIRCLLRLLYARESWDQCSVNHADTDWTEKCVPFPTNTTHNDYCPKNNVRWNGTENFASQDFIRYMMQDLHAKRYDSVREEKLLLTAIVLTWIVIYALAWSGFPRTKTILLGIQNFLIVPVCIACCIVVYQRVAFLDMKTYYLPTEQYLNAGVIYHLLTMGSTFFRLPFLTWVASMKPDQADPQAVTINILLVKIGWYVLLYFTAQVCVFNVIQKYKLNKHCLVIEYYTFVYALLPDYFSQTIFGPLFTALWLLMLNMYVFLRAVCVLQMAIETICQKVPTCRRYPAFISALLVAACVATVRLHYYESISDTLTYTFVYARDCCVIISYVLFLFGLRFCYTWVRIQNDYEIFYARRPANIWNIWLNCAVYISLLLIIFIYAMEMRIRKFSNYIGLLLVLILVLITLPICLVHSCSFIYHGNAAASIYPKDDWLSCNPNWRQYYATSRDERKHKAGVKFVCNRHMCLNQISLNSNMVAQQRGRILFGRVYTKKRISMDRETKTSVTSMTSGDSMN